ELLYGRAEDKYVCLVTRHGRHWVDDSLADIEQRAAGRLLRVHRAVLVAPAAVRALERAPLSREVREVRAGAGEPVAPVTADPAAPARPAAPGAPTAPAAPTTEGWVLRMADGRTLPVARRQLAAVREALRG
ncbi:MAG: hypothetical protein RL223_4354, partial [Pseudomonadota bacterium]